MKIRFSWSDILTVAILLMMSNAFISHLVDLSTAESASAGSGRMQLIWAAIYLLTIYRLLPHWRATLAVIRQNLVLCLFTSLAMISAVWSADPGATLRHGVGFVCSGLFGIDFATRYNLRKQLQLITAALWLAIVLSCVVQIAFPSFVLPATFGETNIVDADAWIGIYHHKNIFGHVLATAGVLTVIQIRPGAKHLLRSILALLACLVVIEKAKSGTALVVICTTAFLYLTLSTVRLQRRALSTLGPAICLSSLVVIVIAFLSRDILAETMGRTSNLTGRTDIWSLVFESIERRPILGYGFDGFWQVTPESHRIDYLLGWTVPSSHNLYIDVLLQVGLAGLALFVLAYVTAMIRSIGVLRTVTKPEACWPLAYLLMVMVYGVSESDLYSPNSLYWALFTAACVSATRYASVAQRSRPRLQVSYLEEAFPVHT